MAVAMPTIPPPMTATSYRPALFTNRLHYYPIRLTVSVSSDMLTTRNCFRPTH
jgi:hypothetical protein